MLITGAMLIVYGYNKELPLPAGLGILLVFTSTCGLPGLFFLFRYLRRKRKKRRQALESKREAAAAAVTFDNPITVSDSTEEWTFSAVYQGYLRFQLMYPDVFQGHRVIILCMCITHTFACIS